MIKIEVLEKLIMAINLLNEVEGYSNTLDNSLTEVNRKQQDLLHLIEKNKLKTNECYRVIKELHNVRVERRKIKNDIELLITFKNHKNQLLSIENRNFLSKILNTKSKELLTSKYKNRIYTEEEIGELVGI